VPQRSQFISNDLLWASLAPSRLARFQIAGSASDGPPWMSIMDIASTRASMNTATGIRRPMWSWQTRGCRTESSIRTSRVLKLAADFAAGFCRQRCFRKTVTARSRSRAWAARALRRGPLSSLTSSIAGCGVRNCSSSMARRGSTRPSPQSGTACRSSAARSTSTGTLEKAGERLFTFTRLPPSQWRSVRTTDEMDKQFLVGS
jgi:hypothetical protein